MLSGLRALTVGTILFAASASLAPFQCAGQANPDLRREEEPGEALYGLAEQFRAKGDSAARAETLRYLVKKYPTSRFAEAARLDLEEIGGAPSEGEKAAPTGSASAADKASPSP